MAPTETEFSDCHSTCVRIKGGAVNVKPKVKIAREAAGMALVDGDNGMGHVVMSFRGEDRDRESEDGGRGLGRRQ